MFHPVVVVTGGREHRVDDDEDVDDDDDDDLEDKESVVGAPADGYFARLVDYIYDRFPHSKPLYLLTELRV